jgi:hypothetical protein
MRSGSRTRRAASSSGSTPKNQDIEVENDDAWVGHDRTKTIDHDDDARQA